MSARFIGWADSPFQTELGFASLGFALVGFLALARKLRTASGRGGRPGHVPAWGGRRTYLQMIAHNNYAAGNSGLLLWMDVVIPLAGFSFLALARPANSALRKPATSSRG